MLPPGRILIVDDQPEMARTLADGLVDRGYVAEAVSSSALALERLATDDVVLVVTDLRMPQVDGLQLLEASLRCAPARPVILMTAYSAIDTAIAALSLGAYHYLTKPFKLDELASLVDRALGDACLHRETTRQRRALAPDALAGESPAMQRLREAIRHFAAKDVPILIQGERGTGKSAIARALHAHSRRAHQPLLAINCGATPESPLDSALFGHARGAFAGATADRPGLFAEARGGAVLLEEIAELPAALQAKVLQFVDRRTVRPAGATGEIAFDVRLFATTRQNVRHAIEAGLLRADLVDRRDIAALTAPPLRERLEDLPALVNHFLATGLARDPSVPVRRFSREAMAALARYPWPGNVRELEQLVQRALLLSRSETVTLAELPQRLGGAQPDAFGFGDAVVPVADLQQRYAAWAVEQLAGNRTQAAHQLGIDVETLRGWLDDDDVRRRRDDAKPT